MNNIVYKEFANSINEVMYLVYHISLIFYFVNVSAKKNVVRSFDFVTLYCPFFIWRCYYVI
jgi:hypothetical protein